MILTFTATQSKDMTQPTVTTVMTSLKDVLWARTAMCCVGSLEVGVMSLPTRTCQANVQSWKVTQCSMRAPTRLLDKQPGTMASATHRLPTITTTTKVSLKQQWLFSQWHRSWCSWRVCSLTWRRWWIESTAQTTRACYWPTSWRGVWQVLWGCMRYLVMIRLWICSGLVCSWVCLALLLWTGLAWLMHSMRGRLKVLLSSQIVTTWSQWESI